MRLSLSILGREIWSLECTRSACSCQDDEEETGIIGGGSAHNFERDTEPLDPTDHYGEWEDRARFGFGGDS